MSDYFRPVGKLSERVGMGRNGSELSERSVLGAGGALAIFCLSPGGTKSTRKHKKVQRKKTGEST